MARSKREKAKALEAVGKLITSGMKAKAAIAEVGIKTGIPARTIESWRWPINSKKRRKEEDLHSKVALKAVPSKEENLDATIALSALVYTSMKEGNKVIFDNEDGTCPQNDLARSVRVLRGMGFNDMSVLYRVAAFLYSEVVRLRKCSSAAETDIVQRNFSGLIWSVNAQTGHKTGYSPEPAPGSFHLFALTQQRLNAVRSVP